MAESMTKREVFDHIKRELVEVIADLPEDRIKIGGNLTGLGVNSVDRVDVLLATMTSLKLQISLTEFRDAGDSIQGLVDFFHAKVNTDG